jgi:hypothetical protein
MNDLIGVGRAVEKFLELVQSSIGTLYRPRAIRKEGQAQAEADAYRLAMLAEVQKRANRTVSDPDRDLAERALARLRHQEIFKQSNIETIVDATTKLLEGEHDVRDNIDRDWLHYFFESCSIVSDKNVQELWSKILARKVTSESRIPRKIIDCLRWLDASLGQQFLELAPRLYLFEGFFTNDIELRGKKLESIGFPFNVESMQEIGLIKENMNRTFGFRLCSMRIECRELSDRSLEFRHFYELTEAGRRLAEIVCPGIVEFGKSKREREVDADDPATIELANYTDARDELETMLAPAHERIRLTIGNIIDFLIQTAASISIEKEYWKSVKYGRSNHIVQEYRPILTISKRTATEIEIKELWQSQKRSLHGIEVRFLRLLVLHLKANEKLICGT